jgi:hypothetical protein
MSSSRSVAAGCGGCKAALQVGVKLFLDALDDAVRRFAAKTWHLRSTDSRVRVSRSARFAFIGSVAEVVLRARGPICEVENVGSGS